MSIGFAGSPEFAATILDAMLTAGLPVTRVITQPPRPAGRRRKLQASPVHRLASDAGLTCHTPEQLQQEVSLVADLDVFVVAAYGKILPEAFLRAPRHGSINIHASLLPRWRGASPVEHALLAQDPKTGVSLMQIEKGLDTGPVYIQQELAIESTDTTDSLTHKLAVLGGQTIIDFLHELRSGKSSQPMPQRETGITYAPRLTTADARIDWTGEASFIESQIRAFNGRTAAHTSYGELHIKILEARVHSGDFIPGQLYPSRSGVIVGCGSGGLNLLTVQLNRGKGRPLPIKAAMNGYTQVFSETTSWDLK